MAFLFFVIFARAPGLKMLARGVLEIARAVPRPPKSPSHVALVCVVCAWYDCLCLLSLSCEILGLSSAYFVVAAAGHRGWAAQARHGYVGLGVTFAPVFPDYIIICLLLN